MMGQTGTPVEMDECFIGGKPKNMHRSKRLKQRIGMNGIATTQTDWVSQVNYCL